MDGNGIFRWERACEMARTCGLQLCVRGSRIELLDKHGYVMCVLGDSDEAHSFMCGYTYSGKEIIND